MSRFLNIDDTSNKENGVVMFMKFWKRCVLKKKHLSVTKSSLSRHLLNLKVLPTSKALKLYTTMSSTSTTNRFALMFKQKLYKGMMNCDGRLRCFSETSTNIH